LLKVQWPEKVCSLRATKVRLFVEADLLAEGEVVLSHTQAHYLTRVMRLAAGEGVRLFNGRDGEWQARIEAVGRGGCVLRIGACLREQLAEPGPWLGFAPLKKDAQDILMAQATELGVEKLIPVHTRFTSVARVNRARLQAQVIEASEQCGRLTIPEVAAPCFLQNLLAEWPASRLLLFADERGFGRPIADAANGQPLATCSEPPGLLIGPEGGFTDDEVREILAHPRVAAVGLGPRILRAETAAVAALACWQALRGDWRRIDYPGSHDVRTEY
jgi:16S rRNA (uracil1498-N3)-methyltransferase